MSEALTGPHREVRVDRPGRPEASVATATAVADDRIRPAGLGRLGTTRWAIATAFWPWVLSRLLVGLSLAVARQVSSGAGAPGPVAFRVRQGLLGWDAAWYESIARYGYWGAGHSSLRFFPLLPLAARAVSELPGVSVGAALLVVTNLSALGAIAWIAVLVREESADHGLVRRAVWLMALAPFSFTLVMGYSEATLLFVSVGTFWALRRRNWWLAGALGLLAGLCRPIGVLLVVPAAVEGLRGWKDSSAAELVRRGAAVVGPVIGLGAYLGWVAWRYGDGLAPLTIQEQSNHHGPLADPFRTLAHDGSLLVHGHHLGTALHLPWVLVALTLLVVSFRRWPASYGAFALVVLGASLTSADLNSFERYALSAFPLVLAAANLTKGERLERFALVASGSLMVAYAVLAFTNQYVP